MTPRPKAIILTSTFLRHQYVVNQLATFIDVIGVWQEEKSFVPERYAGSDDDLAIITAHFAARDRSETAWFGAHDTLRLETGATHRRGPSDFINSPGALDDMARLSPDVVLVFGTGLLRAPIVEQFSGRIINLHLGLSPYYRGAGTNFWPLVNREPEFVGATVHYLDLGIDTGPMLAHARPDIAHDDGPHDVGNKAIVAAVPVLAAAAAAHVDGQTRGVPQASSGRLYQRKDFSADAIRRLHANFATGMLQEYLGDRERRDAPLALLSLERTPAA